MKTIKKETKIVTKKPYEKAPSLTVYGKLKDLTAGGTGNAFEGNKGTDDYKKRPGGI
jgi:hypothetical protein